MILHFTVPGPVQNLAVAFLLDHPSTIYNNTSRTYDILVSISWQQPEYPNGELTAYSYRLVETSNSTVEIIADMNTTSLGLSVVWNVTVSPFTNYTAIVEAYTSAGRGETSAEMTVSPEAGNRTDLT